MASYNGVQAAVLSRPGCRLILARSLLTSKNTCVAGVYPRSYSQALCVTCQHWGLAGGSIVVFASACGRRYLLAVLYTMAMRDLPDIYALAQGPQARGCRHIYIRQIPSGHGISNIYHFNILTKKLQRQEGITPSVLCKHI